MKEDNSPPQLLMGVTPMMYSQILVFGGLIVRVGSTVL
jgi:hypothetical protein